MKRDIICDTHIDFYFKETCVAKKVDKIFNVDCRNIYFLNNDDLFGGKVITKTPTYINKDYKLVLRVTYVNFSG